MGSRHQGRMCDRHPYPPYSQRKLIVLRRDLCHTAQTFLPRRNVGRVDRFGRCSSGTTLRLQPGVRGPFGRYVLMSAGLNLPPAQVPERWQGVAMSRGRIAARSSVGELRERGKYILQIRRCCMVPVHLYSTTGQIEGTGFFPRTAGSKSLANPVRSGEHEERKKNECEVKFAGCRLLGGASARSCSCSASSRAGNQHFYIAQSTGYIPQHCPTPESSIRKPEHMW